MQDKPKLGKSFGMIEKREQKQRKFFDSADWRMNNESPKNTVISNEQNKPKENVPTQEPSDLSKCVELE